MSDRDLSKYDPIEVNFEYLDHTADIQIHAWGEEMKDAFANTAIGMFNYIAECNQVYPSRSEEIIIEPDEDFDPENPPDIDVFLFKLCSRKINKVFLKDFFLFFW